VLSDTGHARGQVVCDGEATIASMNVDSIGG
jgi:hypothetical protein